MFYCTLAAAIILGLIRGGKITNLTKVKLIHPWMIFLSAMMDVSLILLTKNDIFFSRPIVFAWISTQYLLLFLFVWLNRRLPYSWIIGLGSFLNGLVILLNKGSMPLAEIGPYIGKSEFANKYLLNGNLPMYHIISENTLLWFLGDVIWIPSPFKIFISIGDLILYAGAFLLVQHLVAGKQPRKKRQPA